MDDDRDGERIEIELTSNPGDGRRRRGRSDDHPSIPQPQWVPDEQGDPHGAAPSAPAATGPFATERGRLVVAALATGIVALFLGWAIGHAGSSGSASDDPPASSIGRGATTAAPSTTEVGVRVPTVSPSDLPTTTRPPRDEPATTDVFGPPTTVAQGWRVEPLTVAPELAALGLDIVGLSAGGDIVQIDLAVGEVARAEVGLTDDGYPRPVEVGEDWILVLASDGVTARLIQSDGVPQLVDLSGFQQLFRVPGTDTFQRLDQSDTSGFTLTQIAYDGTPVGDPVEYEVPPNWWPAGLDPAGGIVLSGQGSGTFHLDGDGSERITPGSLMALSAEHAVAYDCGVDLESCGLTVVDRTTGESRALPAQADDLTYQALYGYFGTMIGATISPDEQSAVMLIGGGADTGFTQSLRLVSLVDGSTIELSQFYNGTSVAWSPDSRYVLYLDGGMLAAYDIQAGAYVRVSPELESMTSFGVRPADPGAG